VTGVTLNKYTLTLDTGGSEKLIATVSPGNAADKTVTWSTSNKAAASVNNGTVTAIAEGTAVITVTTTDGSKTAPFCLKSRYRARRHARPAHASRESWSRRGRGGVAEGNLRGCAAWCEMAGDLGDASSGTPRWPGE